jgi:cyclic pyranopterin phosphate synthase
MPAQIPLCDNWGRPVTELRISLNSSAYCNFSCIFCHKEGIYDPCLSPMTPEEIERIVRVTTQFGVRRVKLTGGEPMLRADIAEIVARIHSLRIGEISMTTNGTRLAKLAPILKEKGLSRVNVSLHTLREDTFRLLTQVCKLKETIDAIRTAIRVGLRPVKINTTLLKSINESEVEDMIEFSRELGGSETNILQLMEFVPTNRPSCDTLHLDLDSVEERLRRRAIAVRARALHRRPQYKLENGVIVEIVRPMHNSSFCMGNNRIRITYDGKFKPCLLRDYNHVDFLTAMRNKTSDADLALVFKRAVSLREPFFKPEAEIYPSKIPLTCVR